MRGRAPHIGPRLYSGKPLRLYRVIKGAQATASDFWSAARWREPLFGKDLEVPELQDAISMWGGAQRARNVALNRPAARSGSIARLTFRPDDQHDVAIHPTPTLPGHYDVWATPDRLLGLVDDILPIRR